MANISQVAMLTEVICDVHQDLSLLPGTVCPDAKNQQSQKDCRPVVGGDFGT